MAAKKCRHKWYWYYHGSINHIKTCTKCGKEKSYKIPKSRTEGE